MENYGLNNLFFFDLPEEPRCYQLLEACWSPDFWHTRASFSVFMLSFILIVQNMSYCVKFCAMGKLTPVQHSCLPLLSMVHSCLPNTLRQRSSPLIFCRGRVVLVSGPHVGSSLDRKGLAQRPEIVGNEVDLQKRGSRIVWTSLKEDSGEKMRG